MKKNIINYRPILLGFIFISLVTFWVMVFTFAYIGAFVLPNCA